MIINRQDLLEASPMSPMVPDKTVFKGFSYGLTECGYDIRIKQDVWMFYGRRFVKASSVEYFDVPTNLMGRILNKSTWARLGVDASMTTNVEPGWRGNLTLELSYRGWKPIFIPSGVGIAQVIFEELKNPAQYHGAYQDQPDRPVSAVLR